ncbi:helix-turn-helix domain-containing protein [Oceanobacillus alkalisoli]|uniref:helix-turn-helix domain-containing protein n=1 Tax=Oceanobacillus alkalisoli TaxID=2925113 RepID=UPI001EEFE31B|nr:helix-turn-helix domain-containing protein [Oceanobacillus alkalisoli]MCF3942371.1 helix-turn-helix domain-containing protein [Oceanobacillus alkalisoli]MCG5103428.1 helix-turn-helix domain-containing protein [Oceanobacillus alkalisoli]
MDVGARLKEARIAKGFSLESLQETTKIQKRYLVAIEEGNFHLLPGKFYARAFIKEYATAVGLDSDELLKEHKEEIPKSESESEIQYTRVERSKENAAERSGTFFSVLPKIIVALLIIGIIGAGIWFYNQSYSPNDPEEIEDSGEVIIQNSNDNNQDTSGSEEENKDEEEKTNDTAEEDETPEDETGELTFEVEEVGSGSPPESTISITNPEEALILQFESETNVWLDVETGNGESLYGSFVTPENSPIEVDVTGEETVHLNIGSTPNLDITVNDVPFEYPIDPSERDHQRLLFNIN